MIKLFISSKGTLSLSLLLGSGRKMTPAPTALKRDIRTWCHCPHCTSSHQLRRRWLNRKETKKNVSYICALLRTYILSLNSQLIEKT